MQIKTSFFRLLFLCIIGLFLSQPIWANYLAIDKSIDQYSLEEYTFISPDSISDLDIQNLKQKKWLSAPSGTNFGVARKKFWVRFQFLNTDSVSFIKYLYFPHHMVNSIYIYKQKPNSVQLIKQVGIKHNFNQKDISARGYPVLLNLDKGLNTYYICLENYNEPLRASAFLLSERKMYETIRINQSNIWLWRGVFLFALVFSIILFFSTKLKVFLYYFVLNIGILLFIGTEIGDYFMFFSVDKHQHIMDIQRFGVILIMAFFPMFLNKLTPIKKYNKLTWKVLFIGVYIMVTLWFISLFPFAKKNLILYITTHYYIYFALFNFLTQLYFLLYATLKKQNNGWQLLIVYTVYVSAAILNVTLPNIGSITDKLFIHSALLYSSIAEIFTFLILMGHETLQVYNHRNTLIMKEKDYHLEMVKAIVDSQERERNKVGVELHDMIGANISVIKQSISKDNKALVKLIDDTINTVRRLSHGLMTPKLNSEDFIDEVKDLCLLSASNELNVQYYFHNWPTIENTELATHLYRILQELLQNTIKHSAASKVYVQFIKNPSGLAISYEDNGVGFPISELEKPGKGLQNIHNRVKLIGGEIYFDTAPNSGVHITITINNTK